MTVVKRKGVTKCNKRRGRVDSVRSVHHWEVGGESGFGSK